MPSKSLKWNSLLITGMLLAPAMACAQTPLPPDKARDAILSYPAEFFASAQLGTAYDMVKRLPGFVFDDGADARGFAGTAGNVLIDGARPTSKTDDLNAILQRIPVARVARIEVIRGGAPGIDMQGQSVVANIVLKNDDSTSVVATLQNTYLWDGSDMPGGSVEFSRRDGDHSYDLTLTRYADVGDDAPGDGHFIDAVPGQAPIYGTAARKGGLRLGWGVNGSIALPLWDGKFSANVTWRRRTFLERTFYGAPLSGAYLDDEIDEPFELGLNWDRQWGDNEVTLLGLQRLESYEIFNNANDSGGDQRFHIVRNTPESIIRGTWRYRWTDTLNLESGGEVAYNALNGHSQYTVDGTAIALPAENSRANEKRGEAFAQATWKFSPTGTLEAGARYEFSNISATGVPARDLGFIKPRALLSWAPEFLQMGDSSQVRLRVERVVDQLDFSNFIASADLLGNGVSAGNVNIRPMRRWQYEAAYEVHFWGKGAVVASYLHEDITDLVDYIPIGGGLDGPGNIPKAQNDEYKLNTALPLDRLGVTGGLFTTTLKWDIGRVRDAVTGMTRPGSNQQNRNLQIGYSQDLPSLKSTLTLQATVGGWSEPTYRIAQISTTRLQRNYIAAIWDYKPTPDLDFTFDLENFVPYRLDVEQDNYAGPRNTSGLANILDVKNYSQPRLFIQLRKTF